MSGKRLREGNKKCESGNLKGIDHLLDKGKFMRDCGGGVLISIQPFKAGEVLTVLTRKQIKYFSTWFITAAILRSILTLHIIVYSVNSALLTVFRHVVMWIMSVATDPHFVVVDT